MQLEWRQADPHEVSDEISEFRLKTHEVLKPPHIAIETWWSLLADMRDSSIDALDTALAAAGHTGDYHIPDDYSAQERAAVEPEQIICLNAKEKVVRALNHSANGFGVSRVDLGSIVAPPSASPPADPVPDARTVPDGTVTVAVIDDGIAFANNLFCNTPTQSRVEGAYVMGAPALHDAPFSVQDRKLTRQQIDDLLETNTHAGYLDEETFYTEAGVFERAEMAFSSVAFRRSHGTHVMALAAGYEMGSQPDKRPILSVQLPSRVTADVSGHNLRPSLLKAIRYIKKQSRNLRYQGANTPADLVLNFSYGNYGGPHDGTGVISRLIDNTLQSGRNQEIRVVLPAGNANLRRCHAQVAYREDAAKPVELFLNASPDDHTCSYMQCWMPYSSQGTPPNFVKVTVTTPNGMQSGVVEARRGQRQKLCNAEGCVIAELSYSFEKAPTKRGNITLMLKPTASKEPRNDLAPSGRWKVEVEQCELSPGEAVEIWVERDETLAGFPPYGRQAYFDNADYVRFDAFGAPLATDPPNSDSPVLRAGTLSGFACGEFPMVVGGLSQSEGLLSDYSSAGPITPKQGVPRANRVGPDAATRSDDSPVLHGVLSAGSSNGSMVRMNGTSVAAPLAARLVADGLSRGEPANRDWLWAQAEESDGHFPQPKPEDTRTGGGRLDLPYPFSPGRAEI